MKLDFHSSGRLEGRNLVYSCSSLAQRHLCIQQLSRKRGWQTRTTAQPAAESITSGVWDDKYIEPYGELEHATAKLQGVR